MRKTISLILLLSFLSAQLLGCTFIDNLIQKMPHEDVIPEKDRSHLENIGKPIDPIVINEGEIDKSSDLVYTLRGYLFESCQACINPISKTLAQQINDVKNGIQPLHVAFNPDNYYFVVAYYNSPDGHHESDCYYSCANDYTWVCYKDVSLIQEYYNEQKYLEAFQVNLPLTITDIVSGDRATPDMQHYQPYAPTFENGFNIKEALFFDDMFIYLNYPLCLDLDFEINSFCQNTSAFYYCSLTYHHGIFEIPCLYIEGDYYIPFHAYTLYNDGSESHMDYTRHFGEYYDALTRRMQYGKYSVIQEYGTSVYAAISIEDFFDVLVE